MISNRNFTDKEVDLILKNMVILIDTREKVNNHITEWLDYKNRCEYKKVKLSHGDYSCMIKAIPELGITEDLYFHREFVIERKNSLDEISQNFTTNRTRFEEELATKKAEMIIVIEDEWTNLFQGNYTSKYDRKAFIGGIMAFWHRYNVPFVFMKKEEIGVFIYTHMRYFLREKLK